MYLLKLDGLRCQGCGTCEMHIPGLFTMLSDDDDLEVNAATLNASFIDIDKAIASCPHLALSLVPYGI